MNYFIEGLQGAGKSTLLGKLTEKYPGLVTFPEGAYCPVELAWCAYMTRGQYEAEVNRFPELREKIQSQTFPEKGRYIVCYTRVQTENRDFYRAFEQYEVYNGRISEERFDRLLLERYRSWNGKGQAFECALLQNTVEDKMLFADRCDEEIRAFYGKVKEALNGKSYRVCYLYTENIEEGLSVIRKERSDEQGNELWFPAMLDYLESSPRGKRLHYKGMEGLVRHLTCRQDLELRILREIFPEQSVILPSKRYDVSSV